MSSASFTPLPLPYPAAAAAGSSTHRAWVLLDTVGYVGSCNNATTATTTSLRSTGTTVEISFVLADPPGVSRCFVHCTGMAVGTKISHARVISSEDNLVVVGIYFTSKIDPKLLLPRGEFFVYRSGPGKPSLYLLPEPYPRHLRSNSVGILLCDDRKEYFLVHPVEQLGTPGGWFDLHVFSSKDKGWSTKVAQVNWDDGETDYDSLLAHEPSKVMAVGGGLLAWIDLWHGVLTCNPLDPKPLMRLVQLPPPRSNNIFTDYGLGNEVTSPRPFRDLTCCHDAVKFVEIELLDKSCDDTEATHYCWTATVWERMLCSAEWNARFLVDSSEISVADSCLSCLLPEMLCDVPNQVNWGKILAAAPTLGLQGDDDVLYMMSKLRSEDLKAWVLAVNMKSKKLEAVAEFSAERMFHFEPTYLPFAFSSYLGTIPGKDTTNPLEKCTMREKECLETHLLAALDQLKDAEKHLEFQKLRYNKSMPGSASSLHANIQAVSSALAAKYDDSCNSEGKVLSDAIYAVGESLRVLADLRAPNISTN